MANKYIFPSILFGIGFVFSVYLLLWVNSRIDPKVDLIPLVVPLVQMPVLFDTIYVYLLTPFLLLLVGTIFDSAIARAMVGIHKVISLKQNDYLIVEAIGKYRLSGTSLVSRVIIPAFFALSLGFTLVGMFPDRLFLNVFGAMTPLDYPMGQVNGADGWFLRFQAIFYASVLALPITYLISSPLWLLDDAGVTSFRKVKERESINITAVGKYFRDALKGYISVSIVISLSMTIYDAINEAISGGYYVLLATLAVPLLLITYLIPGSILHEIRFPTQVPAFIQTLNGKGVVGVYKQRELSNYLPKESPVN